MKMGWMLCVPLVIPAAGFAAAHTKADKQQTCIKRDLFLRLRSHDL
jgi:hypothetical protein